MFISLVLAAAAASAPSGPAVTCIKTTLKANGHTSESSVAEPSGSVDADRYALKIVRMFNVQRDRGVKYEPETGFVLVETYPNGAFGMSILDMRGKVLASCTRPEQPGGT